jgi:ADP-heptose:LPS heptosyltransferase
MQVKHILLVHQGAIGDLIVSLPSFYAIRRAFPDAIVEAMGYPGHLSLINHRFYADAVCSVDRAEVASLYNEQGHIHPDIIAYMQSFDKIYLFGGNAQKSAMRNLAALHGPELFHITTFPENENRHVIDFQLKQLHSLGYDTSCTIPRIFLLDEDIREAKTFIMQPTVHAGSRPLIAIHPGSGSAKKNWPVKQYAAFVHALHRNVQGTFLIIEGPADEQPAAQLREEIDDVSPVMLQTPALPVLAAILQECAVFIGNDGGVTHLAAATGIPVVAIFGPSDSRVWGPRGEKVRIVKRDIMDGTEGTWVVPSAVLDVALTILTQNVSALN